MPRRGRSAVGGVVYHVLNRANAKAVIFRHAGDYLAFEAVLEEAHQREPIRILDYCVMPTHWHMVLWPERDGQLSQFMAWLTLTHTQRWHAQHRTVGMGHLYQGRFKSFPVQTDAHLLGVCHYVERNPLRVGLVPRAEEWRWGSLWRRERGKPEQRALLSDWPVERPPDWLRLVNDLSSDGELDRIRQSVANGRPFGAADWQVQTAQALGLEHTLRPRGRPRKRGRGPFS